jgi:hypothetical protein
MCLLPWRSLSLSLSGPGWWVKMWRGCQVCLTRTLGRGFGGGRGVLWDCTPVVGLRVSALVNLQIQSLKGIFLPCHRTFPVQFQFSRTRHPLYLKLQTNYPRWGPLVRYFIPRWPRPLPSSSLSFPGLLAHSARQDPALQGDALSSGCTASSL